MISLKIALRFLKASRGQTILVVLGIAIGVSVQVFVGSLIGSLQSSLLDATIGRSSQVTITANGTATVSGWQEMVQKIEALDSVKSVSVSAESPALLNNSGNTASVVVRGFDFPDADKIYRFTEAVYEGSIPRNPLEVLVGKYFKKEHNLHISSELTIATPSLATYQVIVVGFFDLGISSINRAWILTSLASAQQLFGFGNDVTSIEIQVNDVFKADKVATQVKQTLATSAVKVSDWKTENQQLLTGLQGQSISSYMIQVFVLVSVVIAIASVLAIKVVQKSRQLGILKAMGITDRAASMVFLYEGLFLGIGGAISGILIGMFLLYGFSMGTANPDGSSLIRITIDYSFIIISCVIAILAATFAAVLPARRSARLSPIEVIRSG